jgi:hypothetical protein
MVINDVCFGAFQQRILWLLGKGCRLRTIVFLRVLGFNNVRQKKYVVVRVTCPFKIGRVCKLLFMN